MSAALAALLFLTLSCSKEAPPPPPLSASPADSAAGSDSLPSPEDTAPAEGDTGEATESARCGNGILEEGEECDDAGESESCDWDCTLAECGDALLNLSAGEECDPPDGDETCLEDCRKRVGNCHTSTPWEEIASALHEDASMLPVLPESRLATDWPEILPELSFHDLEPSRRYLEDSAETEGCELPDFWDADRVEVGGWVPPDEKEEAEGYCRVRATPGSSEDPGLYFVNRDPVGSIHVPVTGEPSWVRLRFPIPEEHQAVELSYSLNQARLFGSHPELCHEGDQEEDGSCGRLALAEDEVWDEEVPPGLFLLWGRAEDCEGWLITGPHEPAADATWSSAETYTVEVPESLRQVDELVVSLLVYHQYPGGCDGDYCVAGEGSYYSLGFSSAELQTEAAFMPPTEPPEGHPRLLGEDRQWLSRYSAFETLACDKSGELPENSTWGGVPNLRNIWDLYTRGGYSCLGEAPASLEDHGEAAEYLTGAAESFDHERALRVLYLLRHERACQELDPESCWFPAEEVGRLAEAVIEAEMARIEEAPWSTMGFDMDLYTREPLQVYSLLADVLWDELSEAQHQQLLEITGQQMDAYLTHFYEPHWAIYNGNNWTPVLAEGALYWALVWYHEDERAPEVAWRALQTLWLHRDFYLEDGVYREGLLMYSQVSFDPLMSLAMLAESAFGFQLDSLPWERFGGFADWALAFMAPDGHTIDFSDAWIKRGWSTFMPLLASMADPETLDFTAEPDPCLAHVFFANKYYYHGLTNPWRAHPALARDWLDVTRACEDERPGLPSGLEAQVWEEGGWGSLRVGLPGATELGEADSQDPSRTGQADQVMLAVSAIPNTFAHTELDFATLVWTAYGNRLLWDFGYGTLSSDRYATLPDASPDQNPTGHNTLVIPEAYEDGDSSTNTSQIDGEVGSIVLEEIDGFQTLLLEGSAVYGRDDAELGWLESFERRLIGLESGHFLVIDDFLVRADRGEAWVSEYWQTMTLDASVDPTACTHQDSGVELRLQAGVVDLLPVCSNLDNLPAQSAGRMLGLSLEEGAFVEGETVSIVNRLNQTDQRDRFRWEPSAAVTRDLRVFALLASSSEAELPAAELVWSESCGSDLCAELWLEESLALSLEWADEGDRHRLLSILAE